MALGFLSGQSIDGNVTISTVGVTDNLLLTSTDASSASAPDMVLFRNTAIADSDTLGVVEFDGMNGMVPTSNAKLTYNAIYSRIADASNNQSILTLSANKGNGSGAFVHSVNVSAIGSNNSATGAIIINPPSDFTLPTYNLDVRGNAGITGDVNTSGDVHIDEGSTTDFQTTNKLRFGHTSWNNNIGIEFYWMRLGCNQNEGFKFEDSNSNMLLKIQGGNNTGGNGALSATFAGDVLPTSDAAQSIGGSSKRWNFVYINNALSVTDGNINSGSDFSFNQGATFTSNVTAPSFTGRLQGAVTGAPDVPIWVVSGQYPDWGMFYNEGNPDVIEFKSSGNVKATISLDHGDYTGRNATLTGSINAQSISGTDAGNVQYLGHPESSKLWTGIDASGATAKRYHIARLYGAPAHWDSNWQNIEILATCEYYESASLEYCLTGDYGGAGTQANMIKLYLKEKSGGVNSRFKISLGTPVDAGWDYSNADVFYVDVYADVAYYTQWKVSFKCFGHTMSSAAPTSGGAYTQYFASPTSSTISDFFESHEYKFFGAKKLGFDDNDISSLAFSGTTTKTLTLTQNDGSTITGTFTDDTGSGGITQSAADTRYVNVTGDAMTGDLTLNTGSKLIFDTSAGNERGYIQATDTNDAHLIIATSGGEDISFRDGGVTGGVNMIIRGNGDVLTTINHYARAYYDSVSTGYFLDPGGNSSSYAANLRGRVVVYDEQSMGGNLSLRNLNRRFYGGNHYEPGQTVLTAEHTSDYVVGSGRAVTALVLGNTPFGTASASSGKDIFNITRVNQAAYGPSTGMGGFSKVLNLRGNGDLYLGHSNTTGSVYATKYYDKASTSYYLHPSSNTSLKTVGSWRANNSTWDGEYAGKMQYHGNSWYIQTQNGVFIRNASGSNMVTMTTAGVCTANNDWRAPNFYDSADTTYYINLNGTGTSMKVAGKIEHQGIIPTTGTEIDQIKEFSLSLQLTADTWTNTTINATDLDSGTYVVQMAVQDYGVGGGHYDERYSGIMSWYSGDTNDARSDEIVLHRAGHAPQSGTIQLRTRRTLTADTNDLILEVKHNLGYNAALDNSNTKFMRFKFRRLI